MQEELINFFVVWELLFFWCFTFCTVIRFNIYFNSYASILYNGDLIRCHKYFGSDIFESLRWFGLKENRWKLFFKYHQQVKMVWISKESSVIIIRWPFWGFGHFVIFGALLHYSIFIFSHLRSSLLKSPCLSPLLLRSKWQDKSGLGP